MIPECTISMKRIIKANNSEMILALLENNIGKSIISKLALTDTLNWQELAPEYRYRDLFIIQNVQSPYPETAAVYDVIKDLLIQLSEEADA